MAFAFLRRDARDPVAERAHDASYRCFSARAGGGLCVVAALLAACVPLVKVGLYDPAERRWIAQRPVVPAVVTGGSCSEFPCCRPVGCRTVNRVRRCDSACGTCHQCVFRVNATGADGREVGGDVWPRACGLDATACRDETLARFSVGTEVRGYFNAPGVFTIGSPTWPGRGEPDWLLGVGLLSAGVGVAALSCLLVAATS